MKDEPMRRREFITLLGGAAISDCTEHNVAAVRLAASRHAASAAAVLDHDPPPRIHAERADRSAGCKRDTI